MIATTNGSFISNIFSTTVFPLMLSVLLFQFIGFQYSAYIAGEVRGNVRRGVLIALIGALVIGVLANSVYVDAISSHFGFNTNVAWGGSYWGFNTSLSALPLGQPNSMPLLAVVANKSLWPLWTLISLGGVVFPFLLCPVYINFISRMQLAWSLDRQMPEWFGQVSERLRAPLNAILATLGLTALFLFFQSYKDAADVPGHDRPQAQPRRHGVVLDRDGDPDLVPARRQRDAGAIPPPRPDPQRPVRQEARRGSALRGSCSRCGSTSSPCSSRSSTRSRAAVR